MKFTDPLRNDGTRKIVISEVLYQESPLIEAILMFIYYISKNILFVGLLISLMSTITLTMPIKGILFDKYNPNSVAKISKLLANGCYLLVAILSFLYTLPYSIYFIIIFLFIGLNIESLAGFILGEWIKENAKEEDTNIIFSFSFTLTTIIGAIVMLLVGILAETYGLIVIQIYITIYVILQYIRLLIISSIKINRNKVRTSKIYFRTGIKDIRLLLLTFSAVIFYFIASGTSVVIVNIIDKIGNFFEVYGIYSSLSYFIASFGGYLASLTFTKKISHLFLFPLIYSGISFLLLYFPSTLSIWIFTLVSSLSMAIFSLNYYSILNIIVSQEQYGIQTGFSNAMQSIGSLVSPLIFSSVIELFSLSGIIIIVAFFVLICLATLAIFSKL
ncbi:hypothetical protein [Sulfuracidifex metallicus]|uniref:MFS transporter n=2 Tax=Sulfuracidifex metallicus TaxID=47303 RepID=A0A6A9QP20_SULME|nr:hypothetical protein [Sulfuracidifex metallicus]MUN28931.1 hypothetical protein [Sulfuracidifex metallicus DSM 6482 = JCM 9184]WOE50561.1 hypothetical protein RQ359_002102 [Sulfuracidifex metallicus DSM 6482 = JCM 9184]